VVASIAESKIEGCPGTTDTDPVRNMTVECKRDDTNADDFYCLRTETTTP
jgi:hypothetical protein